MENEITEGKIDKYFEITSEALGEAKENVNSDRKSEAKEILEMVENYISDAKHFFSNEDYVNAFGALNYAHGWLDSGARLNIFNVSNNRLFTVD
ncbi:MAG: DUF357 domain-containing protein [Candidatus Pacearchaeota archaeon]